jgi:hypothetical protein
LFHLQHDLFYQDLGVNETVFCEFLIEAQHKLYKVQWSRDGNGLSLTGMWIFNLASTFKMQPTNLSDNLAIVKEQIRFNMLPASLVIWLNFEGNFFNSDVEFLEEDPLLIFALDVVEQHREVFFNNVS